MRADTKRWWRAHCPGAPPLVRSRHIHRRGGGGLMARRFAVAVVASLIGVISVGFASPAGAAGAIVVRPGQSIQAAIDAASPGTTIVVKRGTYQENLVIRTDGIKLIGNG